MYIPLHVDRVQLYWHKKQYVLLPCVIFTQREEQDKLLKSSKADEIAGDSQEEPTDLKDNPAYLSVSTMPQFTMSADAVYSTVDEANLQNIPHDNSANLSLKMSVRSFW